MEKNMKSAKTLGTMCLVGLAAVNTSVATAADDNWYLGAGIGQSRAKIADHRISEGLRQSGITTTTIDNDDRDIGVKLFGGKQFNKYFAVEGGYFNLGKFGYTAHTTSAGNQTGSAKFQGMNLDGVGILPITDRLAALGRLGLTYTWTKDAFGSSAGTGATAKKNEAGFKGGLGLQYDLTRALALRTEWERYRVNDAIGNKGYVDLLQVGLVYRFGTGDSSPKRVAEPAPYVAPVAVARAPEPVLVIVPIATQQYCSILDIQFEINNTTVQREAEERIDKVAIFMKKYANTTAVIEGHTDEVGSAADNMKLSQSRADSVVTYLATHGIARSRLKAVGYGETRPIADNRTQLGKRMNRRINALIACATDIEGIAPIPDRLTMALELEFDRNSADVRPKDRGELRKVANFLNANPKVTATVEGHTGNLQGTKQTAMEISQRRAQNVMNYLVTEFGVRRSQLAAQGFGQTRRFAYNTSLEGQQENRRVNIILDFPDQK
jgi:OOP family OmpA-OmpF porin